MRLLKVHQRIEGRMKVDEVDCVCVNVFIIMIIFIGFCLVTLEYTVLECGVRRTGRRQEIKSH